LEGTGGGGGPPNSADASQPKALTTKVRKSRYGPSQISAIIQAIGGDDGEANTKVNRDDR